MHNVVIILDQETDGGNSLSGMLPMQQQYSSEDTRTPPQYSQSDVNTPLRRHFAHPTRHRYNTTQPFTMPSVPHFNSWESPNYPQDPFTTLMNFQKKCMETMSKKMNELEETMSNQMGEMKDSVSKRIDEIERSLTTNSKEESTTKKRVPPQLSVSSPCISMYVVYQKSVYVAEDYCKHP